MNQLLSFPKDYFKKNNQRPLSELMIRTLIKACDRQHKGMCFGPQDIKGSVIALINRGLIASHKVKLNGKTQETWYVTPQAISMLANAGIKILC